VHRRHSVRNGSGFALAVVLERLGAHAAPGLGQIVVLPARRGGRCTGA